MRKAIKSESQPVVKPHAEDSYLTDIAAATGLSRLQLQSWYSQADDATKTAFLSAETPAKSLDVLQAYFATEHKTVIDTLNE